MHAPWAIASLTRSSSVVSRPPGGRGTHHRNDARRRRESSGVKTDGQLLASVQSVLPTLTRSGKAFSASDTLAPELSLRRVTVFEETRRSTTRRQAEHPHSQALDKLCHDFGGMASIFTNLSLLLASVRHTVARKSNRTPGTAD